MMKNFGARCVAVASAVSFGLSAPAAAATQAQTAAYSPWAALSAFATQSSSAALCGAAAATATAAQQNVNGCVLPQLDEVAAVAPAEVAPVGQVAPGVGVGTALAPAPAFGVLPLLAGLAFVGALAAFALGKGGSDTVVLRPVSA